ncbi:MAG: PKD domain-containing protein [Motilibacteraceae bacterium]
MVSLRAGAFAALLTAGLVAGLTGCAGSTGTTLAGARPAAAQPVSATAASGGLRVEAEVEPTVVHAGHPATLTVRWQDDDGLLLGTLQEWGDGVGAGSQVPLEACTGVRPGQGTDRPAHTWATPGTYTVHLQVSTAACAGPQESVDLTLPVTVVP